MYWTDYLWFLGAILLCMFFSLYASFKVRHAYSVYSTLPCSSGLTGKETVQKLMTANKVDLFIGQVRGALSDHFDPRTNTINLSASTYSQSSIAAVAVAAHEMGHVMQRENGYTFYKLRTALVPIVNFGSYLAFPLVIIGVLLNVFVQTLDPNIGFYIALVGVVLYAGSFVFTLITLPVELNASRRAQKMLIEQGIVREEESVGVRKVLSAAALTYLASLLTSLVYFLRFFVYVLTIFGRRQK